MSATDMYSFVIRNCSKKEKKSCSVMFKKTLPQPEAHK